RRRLTLWRGDFWIWPGMVRCRPDAAAWTSDFPGSIPGDLYWSVTFLRAALAHQRVWGERAGQRADGKERRGESDTAPACLRRDRQLLRTGAYPRGDCDLPPV